MNTKEFKRHLLKFPRVFVANTVIVTTVLHVMSMTVCHPDHDLYITLLESQLILIFSLDLERMVERRVICRMRGKTWNIVKSWNKVLLDM